MAAESLRQSQRSKTVQSGKQLTQMRGRRKKSLEKKAYEFSALCDADVCLGIRIRETGQVFTLCIDTRRQQNQFHHQKHINCF
jgi:hypothetical protein